MVNLFSSMFDLVEVYEEYLEMQRTGVCNTKLLRPILDQYYENYSAGIIMMERDLLSEIANRWYKNLAGS